MNTPTKTRTASRSTPRAHYGFPVRLFALGGLSAMLLSGAVAAPAPPIHPRFTAHTATATIGSNANLNLQDNALIVDLTAYAQLYTYVAHGYDGGAWDGTQSAIRSSTAASDPDHLTGIGIAHNADLNYTVWWGQTLFLGTETLIQYTYYGDANLDGDVNAADLSLLGAGLGWNDFNYDGAVDATDYDLYHTTLLAIHPEAAPEPSGLALLAMGALVVLRRRPAR